MSLEISIGKVVAHRSAFKLSKVVKKSSSNYKIFLPLKISRLLVHSWKFKMLKDTYCLGNVRHKINSTIFKGTGQIDARARRAIKLLRKHD